MPSAAPVMMAALSLSRFMGGLRMDGRRAMPDGGYCARASKRDRAASGRACVAGGDALQLQALQSTIGRRFIVEGWRLEREAPPRMRAGGPRSSFQTLCATLFDAQRRAAIARERAGDWCRSENALLRQ